MIEALTVSVSDIKPNPKNVRSEMDLTDLLASMKALKQSGRSPLLVPLTVLLTDLSIFLSRATAGLPP